MNTGGPAFPVPDSHHANGQVQFGTFGMTMLDWYAGQEKIGDEELSAGICEHFAGQRPTGDWKTNPAVWYEWEARWRAGVKYMRASAMLAEKARREAVVQDSSTTPDAGKMVEPATALQVVAHERGQALDRVIALEAANREFVEAFEACLVMLEGHSPNTCREARAILAKHKGAA